MNRRKFLEICSLNVGGVRNFLEGGRAIAIGPGADRGRDERQ